MNTKQIGLLGELKAKYDFIKAGWDVCSPEGDYAPYDFIAVKGNQVIRVQVKTAQTKRFEDKSFFDIRSANYYCEKIYTEDDCNYFYLFDVPREVGFLISINELKSSTSVTFRYTPCRNHATAGVRMAEDYMADKVLSEMSRQFNGRTTD